MRAAAAVETQDALHHERCKSLRRKSRCRDCSVLSMYRDVAAANEVSGKKQPCRGLPSTIGRVQNRHWSDMNTTSHLGTWKRIYGMLSIT